MEIQGEFTFNLPHEQVWEILCDPRILASIIPVCKDIRQTSPTQYAGELFFRAGSMAGLFRGRIELLNIQKPLSYDIKVQGDSSIGVIQMEGSMSLQAQEDSTTMHYNGTVHYGGRIISVGSRILEQATYAIVNQSFNTLHRFLLARKTI